MANKTRMEEIARKMPKIGDQSKADPREAILPNISKGNVIPIISNSFRLEQIFHELAEGDRPTVVDDLTAQWADYIEYPMQDRSNLAQVAQYYFMEHNDDPNARIGIFNFLKQFLWHMANTEVDDPALADGLGNRFEERRLSDLVEELDYPKFPDGKDDPLSLLARFPLPVYITTSQSNFLERALEAVGKEPSTQICFWSGEIPNLPPQHRLVDQLSASVTKPLVYHLFGLEEYPQTLVLSEDDYINFMFSIAEDSDTSHPKIPLYLRKAVAGSQLLLIGYRLSNWDFRVLFRLMMKFRIDNFSPRGVLIQLEEKENQDSKDKAVEYLRHYFGKKSFDIEWKDAESFIRDLWNEWNSLR